MTTGILLNISSNGSLYANSQRLLDLAQRSAKRFVTKTGQKSFTISTRQLPNRKRAATLHLISISFDVATYQSRFGRADFCVNGLLPELKTKRTPKTIYVYYQE